MSEGRNGLVPRKAGWLEKLYPTPSRAAVEPRVAGKRGKLLFAIDATASREPAWEAAKQLTDSFFDAVPGMIDIGLAAYGGNRVHTFTPYVADARRLRRLASGISCRAGYTQLLPILRRVVETGDVGVVLYITDAFEEDATTAARLAEMLKAKGTRVIVLFDGWSDSEARAVFEDLAARTGGAVLPFEASAIERLKGLIAAAAVLAVGGEVLLAAKSNSLPGATLLLEYLKSARRLSNRSGS